MAADVLLLDTLADALPQDVQLRVYHISTRPTSVPALYSARPDQDEQKTYCESHLLSIALPQVGSRHELLIFAIELLVFTTQSLTTLFVSKADSTGFLDILELDKNVGSILRNVTAAFLQCLIDARLQGPQLVLSLFARSQNQYLFPGSVEYSGKHVLDDRQLIKWWCKTLHSTVSRPSLGGKHTHSAPVPYILVPGCDKYETRAFFQAGTNQDSLWRLDWNVAYPMEALVPDPLAPLRCLLPRLPDDPKSRFLTDLDDSKDEKGQWRSVKTMEQFWDSMSYRQECSAGRVVGFMWIVFTRPEAMENESVIGTQAGEQHDQYSNAMHAVLPSPGQSQGDVSTDLVSEIRAADVKQITLPGSPPSSSPAALPHKSSLGEDGSPDTEDTGQYYDDERKLPINWPQETRGELTVSSEQYDTLIDHLLQLDFSTRAKGEEGTSSFITKASELAGRSWGQSVSGRKASLANPAPAAPVPQESSINMLTGLRKKRKLDLPETVSAHPQPVLNTLSAALVRKQAKT